MPAIPERRRGFILPTTILVMTLLTVMLTAAFILVSAEFRTTDNAFAMRRAYMLAQAGLQDYLTQNRLLAGGTIYDSTRVTLTDGYADVVARRLIATSAYGRELWVVRSSGVVTAGALSGQTQAQRVVALLATYQAGSLPARGTLVAANATVISGSGFHPLDGNDGCSGGTNDFIMTASGDYTSPGSPQAKPNSMSPTFLASRAAVLDSIGIDWAALLAGDFTPDYEYPTWPVWSGYPVGLATGDVTLTGITGVGILVVTGNLTLTSPFSWSGIIVVGGSLTAAGGTGAPMRIDGMVATGLNNLVTPNSVGPNQLEHARIDIAWNSCNVANVIGGLASMSPIRGSWIDTWSTY